MRDVFEFDIRFGAGGLDKDRPVIKDGFKVTAALDGDVLNPFHTRLGQLFVKKVIKIDVDDASVGDEADVEIPVDKRYPNVTSDKDRAEQIDHKELAALKKTGEKKVANIEYEGKKKGIKYRINLLKRVGAKKQDYLLSGLVSLEFGAGITHVAHVVFHPFLLYTICRPGYQSDLVPPFPIPNKEVKRVSADDTSRFGGGKSRS